MKMNEKKKEILHTVKMKMVPLVTLVFHAIKKNEKFNFKIMCVNKY